jgi:hypothetical protein
VALGRPCLSTCALDCRSHNPANAAGCGELDDDGTPLEFKEGWHPSQRPLQNLRGLNGSHAAELTDCALSHLSVVSKLTTEQLATRYPLACRERWGPGKHRYKSYERPNKFAFLRTFSGGTAYTGDEFGAKGDVPLGALLTEAHCCKLCGNDGDGLQFFSFCLNRPINSNHVSHCLHCGKCFYFRPGFLDRCSHCNLRQRQPLLQQFSTGAYDEDQDQPDDDADASLEGTKTLSWEERGFAREGHWAL